MAGSNPESVGFFSHISSIDGFFTSWSEEKSNGYPSIDRNIQAALLLVDFPWKYFWVCVFAKSGVNIFVTVIHGLEPSSLYRWNLVSFGGDSRHVIQCKKRKSDVIIRCKEKVCLAVCLQT